MKNFLALLLVLASSPLWAMDSGSFYFQRTSLRASTFTASPAGGGGGDFASDNFTDANGTNLESHTPSGGGTWNVCCGNTTQAIKIDTNHAYNAITGDGTVYTISPAPADADYSVTVIVKANAASDTVMGPAGRINTTTGAGYTVRWSGGDERWDLLTYDGGSLVSIGNYVGDSPATAERTVKLSMNGTTIKVYIGGVERISVTDSTYGAAGKAGFIISFHTSATTQYNDDFAANDTP